MAENTNNTDNVVNQDEEIRAKLSDAEKIFVPRDLDSDGDLSDYVEYKTKVFKVVPEKCVLVTKNRFKGYLKMKATIDDYGRIQQNVGFKLLNPIMEKCILVSISDRSIDYEKIKYKTKDGIMATFDIVVVIRIQDPIKYMREGKEQLSRLDDEVHELLRVYAASKNFDELSCSQCSVVDFDPTGKFIAFDNKYGISVCNVIFKEIELPERLQKLYNDRVEEEKKKEAQQKRLESEKERAEMEAQISEIQAAAEALKIEKIENAKAKMYLKKITDLVDVLVARGMSAQEISDYLKTDIASSHGNTIFMGGNTVGNNMAYSVAAGNVASQNLAREKVGQAPLQHATSNQPSSNMQSILKNMQTQSVSKSQKLIDLIEQYQQEGKTITPQCMNLYNMLKREDVRKTIDASTDDEYESLRTQAFQGMEVLNEQQNTQGFGRIRR